MMFRRLPLFGGSIVSFCSAPVDKFGSAGAADTRELAARQLLLAIELPLRQWPHKSPALALLQSP
jgi:hypothetical protein